MHQYGSRVWKIPPLKLLVCSLCWVLEDSPPDQYFAGASLWICGQKSEPHPLSDVQPEVMDGNEADYEANDCDCGERKKNGELVKHAVQSLSSWSEVSFLISLDDTLWNSVRKFIVASMSFIHSDDKTSKLVHISEINLWRFWCILAEYNAWVLLETFNIESDDWAKAPIWT